MIFDYETVQSKSRGNRMTEPSKYGIIGLLRRIDRGRCIFRAYHPIIYRQDRPPEWGHHVLAVRLSNGSKHSGGRFVMPEAMLIPLGGKKGGWQVCDCG